MTTAALLTLLPQMAQATAVSEHFDLNSITLSKQIQVRASDSIRANFLMVPASSEVMQNGILKLEGHDLLETARVLVDGQDAKFFPNSDDLISIRIPYDVHPGDVMIKVLDQESSEFGRALVSVASNPEARKPTVTVGSLLGYVAVYTKGLNGSKLSIRIGSKWRQVEQIQADYSKNLTRVGAHRIVSVEVYVNGELIKVEHLVSQ